MDKKKKIERCRICRVLKPKLKNGICDDCLYSMSLEYEELDKHNNSLQSGR